MKKSFLLFFVTLLCQQIMAIPAYPVRKTVTTEDGKIISVTLRGDEHLSFYTDDDNKKYKMLPSGRVQELSFYEFESMKASQEERIASSNGRRFATRKKASGYKGAKKGLVVLANFSDLKFTVGSNAVYKDYFNKENYNGYDNKGSVHDYFYDQSYGQFDLTFDVVGPVDLPQKMAYYGERQGTSSDVNAKQFAVDAITAAMQIVSDFSKYDWDDDGYVDQVFIIYPGYNEAQGGPSETIWPHEWSISEYRLQCNGKKFATYGCTSELKGNSGSVLDGIGTACHEFSHCLGLPDFYDTSGDSFGMGSWDLMSSGSYLDNSHAPMGYTSYERWVSGWLTPTEISEQTTVTGMKALENSPEAYILYNEGNKNEFYMLENRQNPKWGKIINAHGLMIMHVDYDQNVWWYNQVNTDSERQRMTFIPADNMLRSNYAADPYPGTRNNHSLTDTTTPAAVVYNENSDGSYFMGKSIENIEESTDRLISFVAMKDFVAAPANLSKEWLADNTFKLTWDAVPEALEYEVNMTTVKAPTSNPYEAILLEEDFETSCYNSKVNTLNNVAGKLDTYTKSKGWTGTNLFRGPKGLQLGATDSKLGTLKSPDVTVSYYGLTTSCISASPATAGATVSTKVNLYIDGTLYGSWTLSIKEETSIILSGAPKAEKTIAFEIVPNLKLNVSYFSVHDGEFDDEDFNNYSAVSPMGAPARKVTINLSAPAYAEGDGNFVTKTNSFVYDKAEVGSLYLCKVRAKLGEDKYSRWTSVLEVDPSVTAINSASVETPNTSTGVFDLFGRQVNKMEHGVYIQNGKKVLK